MVVSDLYVENLSRVSPKSVSNSSKSNSLGRSEYFVVGSRDKIDQRLVKYIVTVFVALMMFALCVVQIFRGESDVYLNVLLSVLGVVFGRHTKSNESSGGDEELGKDKL